MTLKIVSVEKSKYLLVDERAGTLYNVLFEFYGIDKPKANDTISFDAKLLNKKYEGYAQPYAFEVVKNHGEYDEKKKIYYAILKVDEKKLLLRRIYG